jgi:FkbM family methyltransferase
VTASTVDNRDVLRTLARRLLNRKLYQYGAGLLTTAQLLRCEGFRTWRSLRAPPARAENRRSITLRKLQHPIAFRPGTPDVGAIVQNLVRHEYGRLPVGLAPRLIIDAGGYIGDVAIYFLNRYPGSHVISLEPDLANLELARENLAPYGKRVRLVPAGLWSHETTQHIAGEFTGARLGDESHGGVPVTCTDVKSIVEESGHDAIDILKLDIEGAEEEVITKSSDGWLSRTKILIVEFHSTQITERCTRHLLAHGFAGFRYRSLQYFFNRGLDMGYD